MRKSKVRQGVLWPFFKWTLTACVWGLILLGGVLAYYAYDLPDIDTALGEARRAAITVKAADGSDLATLGDIYAVPVHLRDLPPALPLAVIATEDRRFYRHFGIDLIGLARAMAANVQAGRIVQGGSTITQQVAKNLFLNPERTIKRKIQELLLALWLEYRFTKEQIFTVYLNRVYLGAGTYGVEAASLRYFGHSARRVSTYQAAMLAGLLKAPSRYNPLADPKQAQARTRQVLANMVNAGYLTEAGAARAMRRKSAVIDKIPAQRSARYFIDWVLAQIPSYVSPGHGDIVVETTLDPGLQRWTEAEVRAVIAESGRAARISEAALVALAPDGAVRIMIGGKRYANSQFNRAVQALRQPGSAFKPIVYLGALEQGLKPDTMLLDAPLDIGGWEPRNFDRRYRGNVTMRVALADSINTVAVRLGRKVGIDRLIKTARRLGITSPMRRDLSLALGAVEMSLLELTGAYAPFANGGAGVWPYAIRAIKSKDGRVLYERSGSGPGRVVKAEHVAAMNGMLAKVLIDGTGKHAKLDRPAAGKTGTSQNSRDAWFIGYTPQLIAGVWMGNDDGTPMQRVTGGGLPAVLWKRFMTHALDGAEERDLPGADPFEEKGFWERLFSSL